jgi:hypothetical protein
MAAGPRLLSARGGQGHQSPAPSRISCDRSPTEGIEAAGRALARATQGCREYPREEYLGPPGAPIPADRDGGALLGGQGSSTCLRGADLAPRSPACRQAAPVFLDSAAGTPSASPCLASRSRARAVCRGEGSGGSEAPARELEPPRRRHCQGHSTADSGRARVRPRLRGRAPVEVAPSLWGFRARLGGSTRSRAARRTERRSGGVVATRGARRSTSAANCSSLFLLGPERALVRVGSHATSASGASPRIESCASASRAATSIRSTWRTVSARTQGRRTRSTRACAPSIRPYMATSVGGGALLSRRPSSARVRRRRGARGPIKGTRPRGKDAASDRRAGARLLASAKDLAELTMIGDLERNDLGRIRRARGVRVEGLPTLHSYASVHHLMADVVARPRPGSARSSLGALFPGGSVTGLPSSPRWTDRSARGRGPRLLLRRARFIDRAGSRAQPAYPHVAVAVRAAIWARGRRSPSRSAAGITWSSDARARSARRSTSRGLSAALGSEP